MLKLFISLFFLITSTLSYAAQETIVFIRHAEKLEAGLGQISCQGLNRSLALPQVLIDKFGKPKAIFAPDPSSLKVDHSEKYSYVRPLATIEPTAIRLGLPVHAQIGFSDIAGLKQTLLNEKYRDDTIFVAWEHTEALKAVREIVARYDPLLSTTIPKWEADDYDSIYVVRISRNGTQKSVSFSLDKQGLDKASTKCPNER